MMAKPMKSLELHYPMIQFLIKDISIIIDISASESRNCLLTARPFAERGSWYRAKYTK